MPTLSLTKKTTHDTFLFMPKSPLALTADLLFYANRMSAAEPENLTKLRQHFESAPGAHMATLPVVTSLLSLLVQLQRPQTIIEVGTFIGASTWALSHSMPNLSHLHTIDRAHDLFTKAAPFFDKEVDSRVTTHTGDGLETLGRLHTQGIKGEFFYIDADKKGYINYLEAALKMASPRALFVFDNTLSSGKVLDAEDQRDAPTHASSIHAFNKAVHARIDLSPLLLPVGDGLTLIQQAG